MFLPFAKWLRLRLPQFSRTRLLFKLLAFLRIMWVLTVNDEMYVVRLVRRGRDLTAVDAGVFSLGILEPDDPVVGVRGMEGLKPLVSRVGVAAHSQQGSVTHSDPRDLKNIVTNWLVIIKCKCACKNNDRIYLRRPCNTYLLPLSLPTFYL